MLRLFALLAVVTGTACGPLQRLNHRGHETAENVETALELAAAAKPADSVYGLGYDSTLERYPVLSGSVPDGRLTFASGSNDGSVLFVPIRQSKDALSRETLDGWVARSGSFDLRYHGAPALALDGKEFVVGFSNQSAIGFDPRYGLAPLRVRSAADCLRDDPASAYASAGRPDDLLCYKLIIYVASARTQANDTLERKLFQNRIALAVRAFTENGVAREEPEILDGAFLDDYVPTVSKVGGKSIEHYGLEVSVTADSRLVTWNAPFFSPNQNITMFSFSATPWRAASFDEPVPLRDLSREYARKTACLDANAQGSCVRVRLADVYKIARAAPREPVFGRPLYGKAVDPTFRCAYGWITPDGDDIFCSVNGMHQYVLGADTQHVLYPLDGGINGFFVRPGGYNSGPRDAFQYQGRTIGGEDTWGGFALVQEKRIEMPLFLGQDASLWRAYPDVGAPTPIADNRRSRTFHMLLHHGKLEAFDPRTKRVLARDQPETERLVSSFVYQPVSLDSFVDGDFLFFHHFQAVRPETRQEEFAKSYADEVESLMVDASGNFRAAEIVAGADERGLAKNKNDFAFYYANEGYLGQGVHLDLPKGAAKVLEPKGSRGAAPAAASLELAFKLEKNAKATRLSLLRVGALALALEDDRLILRDTLGDGGVVSVASRPDVSKVGAWLHVGAVVRTGDNARRYELYLDGVLAAQKTVEGTGGVALRPADGVFAVVGPAGDCTGCRGELVIDEVAVSQTARGPDYFRAAALRPALATTDLHAGALTKAQSDRLASLGARLFRDPVLSTSANGRRQGVSCATCHDPKRAFTDGRSLSRGVETLGLNSPTLINRGAAAAQFFDKRAADLVAQSLEPVVNRHEMNGDLPTIVRLVEADKDYLQGFRAVFGNEMKLADAHLSKALAAFMLTIVSADAPVDRAVRGTDAYEDGKALFFGKARCTSCHAGPNFTDEQIRDNGLGRAVKTPTLREIATTAPYFHDGSANTLEDVVRFYNDPPAAALKANTDLRPLGLSGGEIDDLVTFLRTGFQGTIKFASPQ